MAEVPVQVVVAAFQDVNGADGALKKMQEAQKQGLIRIEDAAVMHKDADGKLHIHETEDADGGKGAVVGGVVGGVIGILAGPGGVVVGAAVGAGVGALAAKMIDAGFPDERLREIGGSLKPNTSAIVAVLDEVWVAEAERQMQQAGADMVTAVLSADIAKQLSEGHDVAIVATAAGESMNVSRTTSGGDQATMSSVTSTPDGVTMESATRNANDVTFAAAAVTKEGAAMIEGTGTIVPEAENQAGAAAAAAAQLQQSGGEMKKATQSADIAEQVTTGEAVAAAAATAETGAVSKAADAASDAAKKV